MGHIELGKWADHNLILAPATAVCWRASRRQHNPSDPADHRHLATDAPSPPPAMNQQMYRAAATQANCKRCRRAACCSGAGQRQPELRRRRPGPRMLDPLDIVELANGHFLRPAESATFAVAITAGPTREALDPVRFISNHSSGKMGFAIARAAAARSARVTRSPGPVSLPTPPVARVDVAALEMERQAVQRAPRNGRFSSPAPPWLTTVERIADEKIKTG